MSQVVAICGTMGSGKSTVIQRLANRLPDCAVVTEDDFNPAFSRSVEEVQRWWERGGRVEEFDLADVVRELQRCCSSGRLVLLETHFGRLHSELRPWIDLQVWIDVPADIAFARKISQFTQRFAAETEPQQHRASLQWIHAFCDNYLNVTRPLFEQQRSQVGDQSDERIRGDAGLGEVCDRVMQLLPPDLTHSAIASSSSSTGQ